MQPLWFILVALILCGGIVRPAETDDARVLRLALVMTLAADFCFAFLNNPLYGLCAFCVVQLIYCRRYGGIWLCGVLCGLWVVSAPPLLLLGVDAVVGFAVLYAIAFACSLAAAFSAAKHYPPAAAACVVLGMLLFACCDVCVGVRYLFPEADYRLIWAFYLPGQALLSVSGLKRNEQSLHGLP